MFSSAPAGTLTVNLIEARKLHHEDLGGKNDPYVELWLDEDYKQKSKTVKNNDNPVWNEPFLFQIEKGSSKHKLHFKVYDEDKLGEDKIGDGSLDISEVFKGKRLDTWAKLPAKMGLTSHGELHFDISFVPN
ncbi:C2 domain-containing protein [Parasitella parasitica]|nr:C2 domain-containing protein [Parasitella parasitica]